MARIRTKSDYNFIAYSDIMTCLAIIFLFIAVAYILEGISDKIIKDDIYNSISEDLHKDFKSKNVQLDDDMSLRFLQDSINKNDQLFEIGSAEMTQSFKNKIEQIWPKYQEIILAENNLKYISEIRIEGHTDTISPKKERQTESYLYNLELSSARAQAVLEYIRTLDSYKNLNSKDKSDLDYRLTANGMSFSRALNKEGKVAAISEDKSIDLNKSRRVEFRINTSNEELKTALNK